MPDLKAYSVQGEENGEIVFAKHAVVARRQGANILDEDFGSVSCTRAPWADEYAPGPVPSLVMIDNGWRFECQGCGRTIDSDLEWYPDDPKEPVQTMAPVENEHGLFCTQACCDAYLTDRACRKACEEAAIATLSEKLVRKFPGITIGGERMHAYSIHKDGLYVAKQCIVPFTFPGCKFGCAHYRYDEVDEVPYVTVCAGDIPAWKAWNESQK